MNINDLRRLAGLPSLQANNTKKNLNESYNNSNESYDNDESSGSSGEPDAVFNIASHLVTAIEYGDYGGLSDEEIAQLEDFLPNDSASWEWENEREMCRDDVTGQMADCVVGKMYMNSRFSEDLSNGYSETEHDARDFFPSGAEGSVSNATGAAGARQGDNPLQKKVAVQEAGSKRLVKKQEAGNKLYKVYFDTEWGEFIVQFFEDGKYIPDADYHTDDKDDALGTALAHLKVAEDSHPFSSHDKFSDREFDYNSDPEVSHNWNDEFSDEDIFVQGNRSSFDEFDPTYSEYSDNPEDQIDDLRDMDDLLGDKDNFSDMQPGAVDDAEKEFMQRRAMRGLKDSVKMRDEEDDKILENIVKQYRKFIKG